MWKIYDEIINEIPKDLIADSFFMGDRWLMLGCNGAVGVSNRMDISTRPKIFTGDIVGTPLHILSQGIKSWNFEEASIGMSAVNAYYNSKKRAKSLGILVKDEDRKQDAFITYSKEVAGKKVAVIGHFPFLEQIIKPIADLSILERAPRKGDFPDSACEYILPEQDYVFITGITLENKTLPRLLELSKNSKIIMVGPTVPMADCLFKYGVVDLASFVVTDNDLCHEKIEEGHCRGVFKAGELVNYKKL